MSPSSVARDTLMIGRRPASRSRDSSLESSELVSDLKFHSATAKEDMFASVHKLSKRSKPFKATSLVSRDDDARWKDRSRLGIATVALV
jgi:hypothetical protein